jgi:hypothetical protein
MRRPLRASHQNSSSRLRAPELPLHAFLETRDVDDDALVGAAADRILVVARLDPERKCPALDRDQLGGRDDRHSDRGRGKMADIEMNAEALAPGRQEMLDRRERGCLDAPGDGLDSPDRILI